MGKVNRRRIRVAAASATMSLVAGPLASAGAASSSSSMGESSMPQLPMPASSSISSSSSATSSAAKAMSTAALPHQSTPLTSTFSCGTSIFDIHSSASTNTNTHAYTHTLCPTGDSSVCPSGELCYAGIPSQVEDIDLLERQKNMEQQEMNRLMEERKRGYVDRFVCGVSYHRAEMDCSDIIILGDHEGGIGEGGGEGDKALPQNTAAHYCPTGQSSVCPESMKCYAAVSCPRQYHDPEPEIVTIIMDNTSVRLLDLYAADCYSAYDNVVQLHHQQTEAVLDLDVNITASHALTFAESMGGFGQAEESSSSLSTTLEWLLLPSSIMGAVSSILPLGIFVGSSSSSSSSSRHPLDELFDVGAVKEEPLNGAAVDSAMESVPTSTTNGADEISIQMIEAAVQKRARLSSGGGRKMI